MHSDNDEVPDSIIIIIIVVGVDDERQQVLLKVGTHVQGYSASHSTRRFAFIVTSAKSRFS